ncbi:hypothetical protein GGQ10_002130 [Salinibacter ruber]|uniref:hypothetical protein n=1 Tax=Salinibacter ruber TaxID=146919 RepID=UPI002169FDF3|nr:hypothetical protein [Salinibacter ruber]MCS4087304.1 hypothetical protein [Salinibacter ruber]
MAGASRGEILRSEIRHLLLRQRAFEKRKRREEVQLIGIRNEMRGIMGGEPIEDPYSAGDSAQQATSKDAAARKELLRRMDFEDTEPMSVEDTSALTE